jgi:hypothetical protein
MATANISVQFEAGPLGSTHGPAVHQSARKKKWKKDTVYTKSDEEVWSLSDSDIIGIIHGNISVHLPNSVIKVTYSTFVILFPFQCTLENPDIYILILISSSDIHHGLIYHIIN